MFADDLNVMQSYDRLDDNEAIRLEMDRCRAAVHSWGRKNRVSFDAAKEHVVILHPIHGDGDPVKLLGCLIDCKLLMNHGIENILSRMRPKTKALLRLRGHYPVKELLNQFKTHIWGLVEYQNGAIFHASSYLLQKLDRVQQHFLDEIGIDAKTAFLECNFAPLVLRRNIGILGLLHKRVLGLAHPVFQRLLPFHADIFHEQREGRHNRQLYWHYLEVQFQRSLFQRSIFSMCGTYNTLSQELIDSPSVSIFQAGLTALAKAECQDGNPNWHDCFSCRH